MREADVAHEVYRQTVLARRMIDKANEDSLPNDHEMRVRAIEFEEGALGYFSNPQTVSVKKFLGCFARARKCWCDYTGEPLI